MPNNTPHQNHELGHQVHTLVLPHAETDLDASVVHTDRQRSTSDAPSEDRGPAVLLWLLALLIAEIEFWMLAFAHMYRM